MTRLRPWLDIPGNIRDILEVLYLLHKKVSIMSSTLPEAIAGLATATTALHVSVDAAVAKLAGDGTVTPDELAAIDTSVASISEAIKALDAAVAPVATASRNR